jgi:hypothetical protein
MRKIALSLTILATLLCAASSHAQATRTWVSGVGDDANPCSRTAPCKTFAGAISKTAPAGEINVLDPGGFGAVTITKSITISSEGFEAGVLVSGTNGIIVSAGPNDVVTLRGLDFNGLGTGLNGIRFIGGKVLHVQNCQIFGFTQQGIDFEPNVASALLTVNNSNIHENGNGILVKPVSPGSAKVVIDHVSLENNITDGFKSDATGGGLTATLRECTVTSNGANGIHSFSPGAGASSVMVDHCSATNHNTGAGNGIFSDTGVGSVVRITDNTITGNLTGVLSSGSASIVSFGNNHSSNVTNGTPNP